MMLAWPRSAGCAARPNRGTLLVIVLASMLIAGCAADHPTTTPAGTPTTSARTSPASTPASALPAADGPRMIDVGGHRLYLNCRGAGAPTVVYLHGLGGTSDSIGPLADAVTDRVRLCVYDRRNVGRSDTVAGRYTGADSVRELHTLLDAAGEHGPFVLLGASYGGLLATMYAASYPDDVAGLLLLDATLPTRNEIDRLIPEPERSRAAARIEQNPERLDIATTGRQARRLMPTVPDVPLTYLAAEPVELPATWPVTEMRAMFRALRQQFVAAFPRGTLIVVNSPHVMETAIPDRVAAELNDLLDRVAVAACRCSGGSETRSSLAVASAPSPTMA